MYYIIDPGSLSQASFEKTQSQLYSTISEFRINGELVRSTGVRTIAQLVENAFLRETKTLVAIGRDDTLQQVINAVGDRDIVIGFIPLARSEIAETLGIGNIAQAVKTIAGRRIETLDLGQVNHELFFTRVYFGVSPPSGNALFNYAYSSDLLKAPEFELKFKIDDQYQGSASVIGGVIINSRINDSGQTFSPTDGILDLLLLKKFSRWDAWRYRAAIQAGDFDLIPEASVLHGRKIEILGPDNLSVKLGERALAKAPCVVETSPRKLRIIVGKDRKF